MSVGDLGNLISFSKMHTTYSNKVEDQLSSNKNWPLRLEVQFQGLVCSVIIYHVV